MQILFVLIPLSIALIAVAVIIFRWAVRSGQYDDLEGPAHSILFDDDEKMIPGNETDKKGKQETPTQSSEDAPRNPDA
ncbi:MULTISPECIES: cbb3-type cytochrome oxidase assembly protein CcoS [unclassified Hahella]|uniref:cbb3-type cytochrome oxidase assembly protein CcoS n=1 Tax=unclassified Hahella TaxID=2624107 RepID=UPI001C1EAC20|nr:MULTISPECIES: cbb3-type cytochrome oxidase assembly protein CcoS [unclassified Hahella]MBU6954411.1 cbb3-type cytochrome oxidase assembly protein CcoS [Hahella sp. HN01]MDG9667424.1 cbb3-type cytochrome oxidase assembly protein CcoS [Hahella sp. CR1]